MRLVNWYESRNVQQTPDDWLQLCTICATEYRSQVRFVQQGNSECACEFCEAANDPAYKARLDQEYEAFHGR